MERFDAITFCECNCGPWINGHGCPTRCLHHIHCKIYNSNEGDNISSLYTSYIISNVCYKSELCAEIEWNLGSRESKIDFCNLKSNSRAFISSWCEWWIPHVRIMSIQYDIKWGAKNCHCFKRINELISQCLCCGLDILFFAWLAA